MLIPPCPSTRIKVARVREAKLGWAPAFSDGLAFLLGRNFETRIPAHVHSTYVLGVVDEGAVRVTVRGESFLAMPGSVLALQPFEAHAESAEGESGWSFRYLYPTEDVVRRALGAYARHDAVGLRFARPVIEDDALASMLGVAFDRLAAGRPGLETESLLANLFRSARARHCVAIDPHIGTSRSRTAARIARRLIVHSTARRLSVAELAAATRISPFHFTRVFRDEVGLPPYAYYEKVRVARAHDLILAGQPLSSVAYALGFSDQSHLNRHFLRASIMTPGQYATLSKGFLSAAE